MTIPVIWLSYYKETPNKGYWDYAMLEEFFRGEAWNPVGNFEYEFCETGSLPVIDGAVVVIPGRYHADDIDKINREVAQWKWCLFIIMGDEESLFDITKLEHPNMKVWVMSPRPGSTADRFLPNGYTSNTRKDLKDIRPVVKSLDWFFSGQITHQRRQEAAHAMRNLKTYDNIPSMYKETEGFTQGFHPKEYYKYMSQAKIAPCPSGPELPDSFRVYEALEAAAIPVADATTSKPYPDGFWTNLFGEEPPFPIIREWESLYGYMVENLLPEFPEKNNQIFAWWQNWKRNFAYWFVEDITLLSGHVPSYKEKGLRDKVTVLISSSPSYKHPSTDMIEQTINDVRVHLPDSEIIIMLDGVRPEQEFRRSDYEEYKRRLLWKCNHEWTNVLPLVFTEHLHQANCTMKALEYVKTPTILFVEHDTPLTPDCDIPFEDIVSAITYGELNVVRFHFEAVIPEPHIPLMMGEFNVFGVNYLRTRQWSQRPHLASTSFYKDMLERYFTQDSRTMIEDVVYGAVENDCRDDGLMGWYKWRLAIYAPEGNLKRSYNLDGRGEEAKYEMRFK